MEWLIGVVLKGALDWALGKLKAFFASLKKDSSNAAEAAAQAVQDTAKAESITRDSTAEEVTRANDDELSHF